MRIETAINPAEHTERVYAAVATGNRCAAEFFPFKPGTVARSVLGVACAVLIVLVGIEAELRRMRTGV